MPALQTLDFLAIRDPALSARGSGGGARADGFCAAARPGSAPPGRGCGDRADGDEGASRMPSQTPRAGSQTPMSMEVTRR